MAKKGQNQLLVWIKAAFIGASLPLLLSNQSLAENCTKAEINSKIEQFKDVQKAKAALDAVVQCGSEAIAPLELALSADEAAIRANAASALGKMGATAQDAVPVLVDTLGDSKEIVRSNAASSLSQIGRAVQKQPDKEFEWWDLGSIKDLEALKESLEDALKRLKEDKRQWASKEEEIEELRLVSLGLKKKLKDITDGLPYQVAQWFKEKPAVWLPPVGVVLFYLGVFFVYPIFLLNLDELLKSAELEIPKVKFKVSLSPLLLLKYHPRVLDAWIAQRIQKARNNFVAAGRLTEDGLTDERSNNRLNIYGLEGKEIKAEEFKEIFDQSKISLVIWVEGGAGKTSLACQMAKWAMWGRTDEEEKDKALHLCNHRMLPIFIEDDSDNEQLLEAIGRKLRALTGETKEIPPELVNKLLEQRRILVIIDHLLELSEATRNAIKRDIKKFAVKALVINLIEGKLENKEVYEISKIEEFLNYHPWVLDTWVAEHLPHVKSHFLKQPTVSDRQIHIPIQIKLGKKTLDHLAPSELRPTFSQSPTCLLIVGEGGVGKTSLAYQIARWGLGLLGEEAVEGQSLCSHDMLPVLIEKELENTSLLAAIQKQLPRTPEGDLISNELLQALLKRQRVLVILDHVSEMSDQTYNQMQEALAKTPVNALIITSRLKEKDLGCSQKTWLSPQKIEGARLSTFIQPYLEAKGKKDIFEDDAEFYRTCTRLATMMAATLQSATALLVRMYVDQVIEVGGLKTALLPDDIPTLMVKYLEWLNRGDAIDEAVRQDDSMVLETAKAVAWICLRDNYYQTEARYEDVIRAIAAWSQAETPQQDAKERLTYLQQTLRLVKREANHVKIILDPVAEYLAAFKVVAVCQQREGSEPWSEFFPTVDTEPEQEARDPWSRFLQTVDAQLDLDQIHGFLLALYNCCRQEGKKLPNGVLEKLEQRAKLDSEELEQVRRRQQINRLIDELYYAEPKYLEQAIRNLRDEGIYAHKAIPDLLKVLKSGKDKIEAALRVEALNALMQIQVDAEKRDALCRELLADRSDAPEVRVAAIRALWQLDRESEALVELLKTYFQDESELGVVRVQAGEGLRKLGVLQELLVVELSEDATPTIHLLPTPETRIMKLPKDIELVMVRIPGGTFGMGAPSGEGYDSERPQHEVTVAEFWMGQFSVTQAQYEAVMDYNPSTFSTNGSNRPVETLSWDDAVDFCQRLSELTDQEFRLPSEAEWEYACRARTTTPFYFGETITTDYANYRGTDWNYGGTVYPGAYGQGPKGIFREQTTEVGSFPPNTFGLYDLHGNVWEWCQDDWHGDYQDAPNDGSAWVSEYSSNKVIRGGSWNNNPDICRSATRNYSTRDNRVSNIGFRVVCVVPRTT